MELLLQYEKNVELVDIEMIHFKEDRPNGKPWQKDNDSVLESLLNQNYSRTNEKTESYVDYTHTHSGPETVGDHPLIKSYKTILLNNVVQGAITANNNMRSCEVGWDVTTGDIGRNRRREDT